MGVLVIGFGDGKDGQSILGRCIGFSYRTFVGSLSYNPPSTIIPARAMFLGNLALVTWSSLRDKSIHVWVGLALSMCFTPMILPSSFFFLFFF